MKMILLLALSLSSSIALANSDISFERLERCLENSQSPSLAQRLKELKVKKIGFDQQLERFEGLAIEHQDEIVQILSRVQGQAESGQHLKNARTHYYTVLYPEQSAEIVNTVAGSVTIGVGPNVVYPAFNDFAFFVDNCL
jgi:hypothetical protein